MPEFYMIFARKINKIPEFYMIYARKNNKMPEFYMIFARKIYFSRIWGEKCPLCPRLLRLWCLLQTISAMSWIENVFGINGF